MHPKHLLWFIPLQLAVGLGVAYAIVRIVKAVWVG